MRATAQAEALAEANARATEVVIRQAAQLEAEHQRDMAISRQLSSQAITLMEEGNWEAAFPIAIEAGKTSDTQEAFYAIRLLLAHPGSTRWILDGHGIKSV